MYNLKRRIASLPPIESDVFREQVLATRKATDARESRVTFQWSCTVCQKLYRNRNGYLNHVKSEEHLANIQKNEPSTSKSDQSPTKNAQLSLDILEDASSLSLEDVDDTNLDAPGEPSSLSKCPFCNSLSTTLELNLDHMCKMHGMFIPDQDYLYDLEIFIGYLSKVISEFCTCLYCGKIKDSAESVRQHMLDKGHCMLNFDDLSEYDPFYDFPSDSEAENAETAVTLTNKDSMSHDIDQKAVGWQVADSKPELRLSGKVLGHRSQSYLHRQNLHRHRPLSEAGEPKAITEAESSEDQSSRQNRPLATRANGGSGMIGVSEQQKRALIAVEKKLLRQETTTKNKYRWSLEKQANYQKHFKMSIRGKFTIIPIR